MKKSLGGLLGILGGAVAVAGGILSVFLSSRENSDKTENASELDIDLNDYCGYPFYDEDEYSCMECDEYDEYDSEDYDEEEPWFTETYDEFLAREGMDDTQQARDMYNWGY